MITKRIWVNVAVFLGLAGLLIFWGATGLVFQKGGGRTFTVNFKDASGLLPRNDVTMRGVPVGQVSDVVLLRNGVAHVSVALEPGITVPSGTWAQVTRRSPIGDMTLELSPGRGSAIANGGNIPMRNTIEPPDPERTITLLAQVLRSVPSQDLQTVIRELATGLRGRGQDLAALNEASAELPEKLLEVRSQLSHLIRLGPKVTGVLAANSKTLADDLSLTADLADILRDNRFDLVHLTQNGARFLQVANELIATEKPNLACLVSDFGHINATLAEPQHLSDLENTLELNHFFFDAVVIAVRTSRVDGYGWFRVQLLPPQQPAGRSYHPRTPPNDVFQGNACHSIYGPGVGPPGQPGPVWLARGSSLHTGT
jgi:phospholipid/cholesterol/gamma-HCH transport system substrate-binding protein